MPTLTATATAKSGPADQITALVLTNVTSMEVRVPDQVVKFKYGVNQTLDLDLNGVTTFTVTIASTNYTVTIS